MTAASVAAKSLQSCLTLCDPIDSSPPGSPSLGFSRQDTGLGCHFLLQCMKMKSEREAAQSSPALSDPMDCSPPAPSIHGILQAKVLEWGCHCLLRLRWGFNPGSLATLLLSFSRSVLPDCFVTPMDCSPPGPLSIGFPRQEHWRGLLCPSAGALPNPGIKPISPALSGGFSTTEPSGNPNTATDSPSPEVIYRHQVTDVGIVNPHTQ